MYALLSRRVAFMHSCIHVYLHHLSQCIGIPNTYTLYVCMCVCVCVCVCVVLFRKAYVRLH